MPEQSPPQEAEGGLTIQPIEEFIKTQAYAKAEAFNEAYAEGKSRAKDEGYDDASAKVYAEGYAEAHIKLQDRFKNRTWG